MQKSLTQGAVGKTLILFSLPMIAGICCGSFIILQIL